VSIRININILTGLALDHGTHVMTQVSVGGVPNRQATAQFSCEYPKHFERFAEGLGRNI
jgi:hypothetical protein